MDAYIFKLKFTSPVHFGDTGIDLENVMETVSSDTLFSALVNAIAANLGIEEASKFVNDFFKNPPCLFTSLFPYNENNLFLPKPMDDSFIDSDLKREFGKNLKKINWLKKEDFLAWLKREVFSKEKIKELSEYQNIVKNSYNKEIRPRVTIDRMTNQTTIYHCGYIHFCTNAGLYGLVYLRDTNYFNKFKLALNLLGQTGLGGEKTYGCGMFEVEIKEIDSVYNAILNLNAQKFTLLSLYHPEVEELQELNDILECYNFMRKKGWITSGRYALPIKRKSVGFITEGSVLNKPVRGTLVDVTPENIPDDILKHKVFRYGYAFTVPLRGL